VARVLQQEGIGTLLMDLLTREEDRSYKTRFDIDLLTKRLLQATSWLQKQPETHHLMLGYFGASTGAAAALKAAAALGESIRAVVSRGGRPDLAGDALERVQSPTLLMVGGNDEVVLQVNRAAFARLPGKKDLVIVPGATHLFEEPGALEQVAHGAAQWFKQSFSCHA
jgi:dienelactone hydrolase